tara:strand:+ start:2313 stop:2573 length:261 start_codon:yes stop_codon:yes gene_type:complete
MKTNEELVNEMQVMFDTYKEVSIIVEQQTGKPLNLEMFTVSDGILNALRIIDNIEMTLKLHAELHKSLEIILLTIEYHLPSFKEEE